MVAGFVVQLIKDEGEEIVFVGGHEEKFSTARTMVSLRERDAGIRERNAKNLEEEKSRLPNRICRKVRKISVQLVRHYQARC